SIPRWCSPSTPSQTAGVSSWYTSTSTTKILPASARAGRNTTGNLGASSSPQTAETWADAKENLVDADITVGRVPASGRTNASADAWRLLRLPPQSVMTGSQG